MIKEMRRWLCVKDLSTRLLVWRNVFVRFPFNNARYEIMSADTGSDLTMFYLIDTKENDSICWPQDCICVQCYFNYLAFWMKIDLFDREYK